MTKYRKKPIVIEAKKLLPSTLQEITEWCGGRPHWSGFVQIDGIEIDTLEGEMLASFGDYVIKGVKGEFYPCKPDIFDLTYEEEPGTNDG